MPPGRLEKPSLPNVLFGNLYSIWLHVSGLAQLLTSRALGPSAIRTSGIPKVSVLIPTHNRVETLLSRSLRSVLNQSHDNLEIIVLAHGCTDSTATAVRKISDPRIKVIEVPRVRLGYPDKPEFHWLMGPTKPLNMGHRIATGDYIAVIGDDDEWIPDHIEHALQVLRNNNADFYSAMGEVIHHDGQIETKYGYSYGKKRIGGVSTWVYKRELGRLKWNIHSWRKGWNRPNDIDFSRRVCRLPVRVVFSSKISRLWRPRPGETQIGLSAYLSKSGPIMSGHSGSTTRA